MNNIKKIQEKLIEKNLDAVLVTDEKNQRYATGFPFTDGAVIVARSAAWLITDSRYIEAATNTAACCCNVQMFDREHSRLSLIQAALKEAGVERLGAEEEKLSHAEYLGYEKALGMELLPAQAIFSELRASKSEEEIGYLREAQAISEKALAEVLRIIKPGMTERQVAAELVYHMLLNGSEVAKTENGENAYPTVTNDALAVFTIKKVWVDNNAKTGRTPVEISLSANGKQIEKFELNDKNGWEKSFELAKYDENGKEIKYTAVEITKVTGYVTGYSSDTFTVYNTLESLKPKTGDDSDLTLWTMLGLSALLCAGGVGILMYKKSRNAG